MTPGPWRVGEPYAPCLTTELPTVRRADGAHIAYVYTENPADARLIAAAPELLEFAKAVVKWARDCDPVDSFGTEETGSWLSFTGRQAIDDLRAAIAKAEGK